MNQPVNLTSLDFRAGRVQKYMRNYQTEYHTYVFAGSQNRIPNSIIQSKKRTWDFENHTPQTCIFSWAPFNSTPFESRLGSFKSPTYFADVYSTLKNHISIRNRMLKNINVTAILKEMEVKCGTKNLPISPITPERLD